MDRNDLHPLGGRRSGVVRVVDGLQLDEAAADHEEQHGDDGERDRQPAIPPAQPERRPASGRPPDRPSLRCRYRPPRPRLGIQRRARVRPRSGASRRRDRNARRTWAARRPGGMRRLRAVRRTTPRWARRVGHRVRARCRSAGRWGRLPGRPGGRRRRGCHRSAGTGAGPPRAGCRRRALAHRGPPGRGAWVTGVRRGCRRRSRLRRRRRPSRCAMSGSGRGRRRRAGRGGGRGVLAVGGTGHRGGCGGTRAAEHGGLAIRREWSGRPEYRSAPCRAWRRPRPAHPAPRWPRAGTAAARGPRPGRRWPP